MSATPRTDAAECEVEEFDCHALVVTADLPRALETELNAANAELADTKRRLDAVRLALAKVFDQKAAELRAMNWPQTALHAEAKAAMLRDLSQPVDLTKL